MFRTYLHWLLDGRGFRSFLVHQRTRASTPRSTPFLAKDDWPMNINENPEGKPSWTGGRLSQVFHIDGPFMGPIEWDDPADFPMLFSFFELANMNVGKYVDLIHHCFIGRNGMMKCENHDSAIWKMSETNGIQNPDHPVNRMSTSLPTFIPSSKWFHKEVP